MKKIPKTIQVDAYTDDDGRQLCGYCHFLAGCEDNAHTMDGWKSPGPDCPIWRKQDFNITSRIEKLEAAYSLPGTIIQRVLAPAKGYMWSVGFGTMGLPKQFFTGESLDECMLKAEKHFGRQDDT